MTFLNQRIYLLRSDFCNRPKEGLNSGRDSDSEEKTGPQNVSAGQVIAQTNFRIDLVTHIANSLEAQCHDVGNVNDMQTKVHLECKNHFEKKEDLNDVLETGRNYLSMWSLKENPPKCEEEWNEKDIINNKFESALLPQINVPKDIKINTTLTLMPTKCASS